MAIEQCLVTSFKVELFQGIHDFRVAADTFRLALYTSSATLGPTTTAYTATNEAAGAGYVAGGGALTNVNPSSSGTTGIIDFGDITFAASSVTARGAMIYNDTAAGNPAVAILDFGSDKTSSASDFVVIFPAPTVTSAFILVN